MPAKSRRSVSTFKSSRSMICCRFIRLSIPADADGLVGNIDPHEELRAFPNRGIELDLIHTALHVAEPHAGPEAHFAHLLGGGGISGLEDLLGIRDAGSVIGG